MANYKHQYEQMKLMVDGYQNVIVPGLRELIAEREPVRHGLWVDHMCRDWRCSECGEKINKVRNVDGYCYDDKPNYCPNCGAKMDGDSHD